MMSIMKKRGIYLLMLILLLAVEVFIAVFVHDQWVRPYLGDVLVVGVVYCFIRSFLPERIVLLPLYVFLFAVAVEILQLFHLADLIGVQNRVLKSILGSTFDWKDIGCYAIGCVILAGIDYIRYRRTKRAEKA